MADRLKESDRYAESRPSLSIVIARPIGVASRQQAVTISVSISF
jgi:hypothetical protein